MTAAPVPAGYYRPGAFSCWLVAPDTAQELEYVPRPRPNLHAAVFKTLLSWQPSSPFLGIQTSAETSGARAECFPRPLAQHLTVSLVLSLTLVSHLFALVSDNGDTAVVPPFPSCLQ